MHIFRLILVLIVFGSIERVHAQSEKFSLSMGIQFTKNAHDDVENMARSDRRTVLIPRLTYRLDKHWAVGVLYSYNRYTYEDQLQVPIPGYNDYIYLSMNFQVKEIQKLYGILVQNYLIEQGKFRMFFEWDGKIGNADINMDLPEGIEAVQVHDNNTPEGIKYYSSGIHLGTRYNFYKGLGAELRLNNFVSYENLHDKGLVGTKGSSFRLFDNLLGNMSVGLSFSF